MVGSDHSNHAVEQALTNGTANALVDYVDLLAGLALAAGMIGTMINALRVGLLPRWMGILGIFTGLLIFLPIGGAELQVVPAFWMVMMGDPVRRALAQRRAAGVGRRGGAAVAVPGAAAGRGAGGQRTRGARRGRRGRGARAGASRASSGSSRKRRRKRGARG